MTVSYHNKGKMFAFKSVRRYFYFPFAIANHMYYSLKENIIMSTPTVPRFFLCILVFSLRGENDQIKNSEKISLKHISLLRNYE
jgi:hypothetical protein